MGPEQGVGLWIARELLAAGRGRVSVAIRPSGGSAFTIVVPTPSDRGDGRQAQESEDTGRHLNEIAVSDPTTLEGLTQCLTQSLDACPQIAEDKSICGTARFEGGFCATLFKAARNSLILNGEMSEWLKEHAWKACVGETLPWVRIPLSPPTFGI